MRQTIERQSAQLARIVNDMIDISRITRGVIAIEREPVDLAEVARRAVEAGAPAIEAGRHRLEVELPDAPVVVQGDLYRLTQLATNLLNNAAKFTPEGGTIWLSVATEDRTAVLRLRDTGRGIEPEFLKRIFDMFVQGRTGRWAAVSASALRSRARSPNCTAARLKRTAPVRARARNSHCACRLPSNAHSAKRTKSPSRRPGFNACLSWTTTATPRARSSCCCARSGTTRASCTTAPRRSPRAVYQPQVVLLDIGMPGMDGYEVARRLRAMRELDGVRIVAITGWGQEADRQRSREAGFDLHLVKPVDPNELVRVLDEQGGATLH